MIKFACFSPHPPLLLPGTGSQSDKEQVKQTIESLRLSAKKLAEAKPDIILISSPHQNWGFNVPLHFLAEKFKGKIEQYLIDSESPSFYFEKGKNSFLQLRPDKKYALIGSGDLSHCLKKDGSYGFHPDGPKFDKTFIEALKNKDIKGILQLNEMFPEAAECGLRSFCFVLGILETAKEKGELDWQPEILSYEAPFGVGYLVASLQIKNAKLKIDEIYY